MQIHSQYISIIVPYSITYQNLGITINLHSLSFILSKYEKKSHDIRKKKIFNFNLFPSWIQFHVFERHSRKKQPKNSWYENPFPLKFLSPFRISIIFAKFQVARSKKSDRWSKSRKVVIGKKKKKKTRRGRFRGKWT